jgi:hypothetical protein
MRFKLGTNPVATISVNDRGYRGGPWPAPGEGEIVVVGDSQVFGLGVEDDETFSAQLAAHTGRSVINGGVPTYGPAEYLAVAEEIIEERKPQTLIYVVNFVNDAFELDRPNRDRHAVWDGWAVRIETAPEQVTAFPGRKWLFQQSHAFYALRRWWYARDIGSVEAVVDPLAQGLPSEGSWLDLVDQGTRSAVAADEVAQRDVEAQRAKTARFQQVAAALSSAEAQLDKQLASQRDYDRTVSQLAHGVPGDIVEERFAEESRDIVVTAALIRKAAAQRVRMAEQLAARDEEVAESLAKRQALLRENEQLRAAIAGPTVAPAPSSSVFEPHLREVKALCDAHGVEFVVVALPIDVQVSSEEWAKYGVEDPPSMDASLVLLGDLRETAERLGARALDATEALREAEPGAFLDGDIHMTARGHAALAHALGATLNQPPRLVPPQPGLAEGRKPIPTPKAWAKVGEVIVRGSTDAGCRTQILDGWFRVRCAKRSTRAEAPTDVQVLEGDGPELLTLVTADATNLLWPIQSERVLVVRFWWEKHARDLRVTWPAGEDGKPGFVAAFTPVAGEQGRALVPDERAAQLCTHHQIVTSEVSCRFADADRYGPLGATRVYAGRDCEPACRELYGSANAACMSTYGLAQMLACSQGDPLAPPRCAEGEYLIRSTNTCVQPCDANHPCATGTCVPYNGGGVCR